MITITISVSGTEVLHFYGIAEALDAPPIGSKESNPSIPGLPPMSSETLSFEYSSYVDQSTGDMIWKAGNVYFDEVNIQLIFTFPDRDFEVYSITDVDDENATIEGTIISGKLSREEKTFTFAFMEVAGQLVLVVSEEGRRNQVILFPI